MTERVVRRHRTEENVDAPIQVVAVPMKRSCQLMSRSQLSASQAMLCCSTAYSVAGRTKKRHHIAAKHAEISSDDHPSVRARLQALARAPPILSFLRVCALGGANIYDDSCRTTIARSLGDSLFAL
jgi:hypothetical protein